jgi:hypothetical protein
VRLSFYGWWSDPLRALVEAIGIAGYLTTNDKARYDAWLCLHAPAPSTGDNYSIEFARRWLSDGMPRRNARRNRATNGLAILIRPDKVICGARKNKWLSECAVRANLRRPSKIEGG